MSTKDKIIETALDLFSKHGYDNVSMDMVKDAAGIAKGTLYYHFKSKEELFTSSCSAMVECMTKVILNNASGEMGTLDRFISSYLSAIDYLWDNHDKVRMFFIVKEVAKGSDIHDTHKTLLKTSVGQFLDGLLNLGVEEKRARHIAPMFMALIMSIFPGTRHGLYSDKEYYKSLVKEMIIKMIGDIDED